MVGGYSEDELEALYQEAIQHATNVLSPGPNNNVAVSGVLSALSDAGPGNPKIIRAMGNLTLTEALQGYGMLIVEDGDLTIAAPGFDWEGVVMVRKQEKDTVRVSLQNTTINGSFIAYDYEGVSPEGQCVPEFTIVGDEAIVNEPFALRVEVLGAAITASGTYDMPVTARVTSLAIPPRRSHAR